MADATHPVATHLCLGTTPTVQQTMIFDRVAVDEVNRASQVRRSASGKSVNVARILHALGHKSCAVLPVGGNTGRFMESELAAAGIDSATVEIAAPTRTCVTMIDRAGGHATELVEEHGPLTHAEADMLLTLLRSRIEGAKMLILSGSLAAGVGNDFYFRCCMAANEQWVPTILDGRGDALKQALIAAPLVVKPNRQELAATIGKPIDDEPALQQAMKTLQRQGPQWVIVTMGRQGAVVHDGKSFWRVPALEVEAVSPIGSGDAFTAGLAAAITAGQSVPDACRLATACAAANTLVPGSGLLRIEDVRRLEPMVRVERI
jgi:1-phosphofructokinase family hexose kinase